ISIDADLRKPGESQVPRRRGRHVDYTTAHEGATIVDGHDHRMSITLVRDLHLAAEGQRAMGRGERLAIQLLTACGSASAFVGIDRGKAGPVCCRWCEMKE